MRYLIGRENAVFFNSEEERQPTDLHFHDNDSERIANHRKWKEFLPPTLLVRKRQLSLF